MAVAAEETLKPQHIAILGAADDYRPAGAGLQQADAAQDQRAHDPFAELRFRDQQRTQPIGRNDQGLHCCLRGSVHERRPARELGKFAHELPWRVRDNQFAAAGFMTLRDVDMAGENDEEAEAYLTNLGKCLAHAKNAYLAEPAHPLDLCRFQSRKHLGASRFDDRLCRRRHGCSQAIDSARPCVRRFRINIVCHASQRSTA